ncbi:hypothetical protein C8F01DRAFT_1292725 [Mycena amicta]|nr:hypothetical protein C8F01DRAFT_1292725 [Mycena amicta]
MHSSVRPSRLDALPFQQRRIVKAAVSPNCSPADYDSFGELIQGVILRKEKLDPFLPAFYAFVDPSRIPSFEQVEENPTHTKTCVDLARFTLLTVGEHFDSTAHFWPRLFEWACFFYDLMQISPPTDEFGGMNLIYVFVQYSRCAKDEQTEIYRPMVKQPRFWTMVARTWSPALQIKTRTERNAGLSTIAVFAFYGCKWAINTDALIEGTGGWDELARLLVAHLKVLAPDKRTIDIAIQTHCVPPPVSPNSSQPWLATAKAVDGWPAINTGAVYRQSHLYTAFAGDRWPEPACLASWQRHTPSTAGFLHRACPPTPSLLAPMLSRCLRPSAAEPQPLTASRCTVFEAPQFATTCSTIPYSLPHTSQSQAVEPWYGPLILFRWLLQELSAPPMFCEAFVARGGIQAFMTLVHALNANSKDNRTSFPVALATLQLALDCGHRNVVVALKHGLLELLRECAVSKNTQAHGVLHQIFRLLHGGTCVFPDIIRQVSKHVLDTRTTDVFRGTPFYAPWMVLMNVASLRCGHFMYPDMHKKKITSACDNVKASCTGSEHFFHPTNTLLQCGKIQPKSSFAQCSGCKTLSYCSKKCQHADWKNGHRETCREYLGLHTTLRESFTSYELSFLRKLVGEHFIIARFLADPWAPAPGAQAGDVLLFDFTTGELKEARKIPAREAARLCSKHVGQRVWEDQLERVKQSGNRMVLHAAEFSDGSAKRLILVPFRRDGKRRTKRSCIFFLGYTS